MLSFLTLIFIMVLKIGMVKEPVKELIITGFLVRWGSIDGRTGNVKNNLIIIYLNYINN